MTFITNLTTIAGALIPILYIQGNAFWYGYVKSIGLPPDLFQISFEETLIQGYIAATILGLPYLLALSLYLLLALGVAYNVNELSKFGWVKKSFTFFSNNSADKKDGHLLTEKALKYSKRATFILGVVTILIGGALAVLSETGNLGKKNGITKLQDLAKSTPESLIYLNDKQSLTGSMILCSEAFCAIFSGCKTIMVSTSSIEKIISNVKLD